jgi:hypothetical protein
MDDLASTGNTDEFQAGGNAWSPARADILDLLRTSETTRIEPIYYGSNHTFLVQLDAGMAGTSLAVYKPARGEYPLYDFPDGTLYRREIATWLVDSALGWDLVPPTIKTDGVYGPGSLQLFIEGHERGQVEVFELKRLCLLDLLVNNADRKPEHLLVGDHGKLWAIDHGLTFHYQPKLRTVLWHFAGSPIPSDDLADLKRLRIEISRNGSARDELRELISSREWSGLISRLDRLLQDGCFPDPRYKPVPYRW